MSEVLRIFPQIERRIFRNIRPLATNLRERLYDILRPQLNQEYVEGDRGWSLLAAGTFFGIMSSGVALGVGAVASELAPHIVRLTFLPTLIENPAIPVIGGSVLGTMASAYPLIFHRPFPQR